MQLQAVIDSDEIFFVDNHGYAVENGHGGPEPGDDVVDVSWSQRAMASSSISATRFSVWKPALKLAGFTRPPCLEGHMTGWIRAGLPLEK